MAATSILNSSPSPGITFLSVLLSSDRGTARFLTAFSILLWLVAVFFALPIIPLFSKDIIAANKKFFGTRLEKFFCLPCLAEFFGVTEQDILDKIEGFKEDGCALFK